MTRRNATVAVVALLAFTTSARAADETGKPELLEVRKIWDRAPHNAFTDLIRFKDRWFCAFREGAGHVSPDGAIRVLESADGKEWSPAAHVTHPGADLRDAKLSVTPDGRLMLNAAAARRGPGIPTAHRSMVWFSKDGKEWGEGKEIADPDVWVWRATWHRGTAYAIGYGTGKDQFVRLYASPDGVHYETRVERLFDKGHPNEHALVFLDDGTCLCLLRRDGKDAPNGLLGTAKPLYTDWTWKDLGRKIGGPAMTRLPDGRLLAGVRLYEPKVRTALCWIDPRDGKLTECLALPSGGDTSYPGLVWHDGLLWVSYYSSHEGKTSIYLAKVKLPAT